MGRGQSDAVWRKIFDVQVRAIGNVQLDSSWGFWSTGHTCWYLGSAVDHPMADAWDLALLCLFVGFLDTCKTD